MTPTVLTACQSPICIRHAPTGMSFATGRIISLPYPGGKRQIGAENRPIIIRAASAGRVRAGGRRSSPVTTPRRPTAVRSGGDRRGEGDGCRRAVALVRRGLAGCADRDRVVLAPHARTQSPSLIVPPT